MQSSTNCSLLFTLSGMFNEEEILHSSNRGRFVSTIRAGLKGTKIFSNVMHWDWLLHCDNGDFSFPQYNFKITPFFGFHCQVVLFLHCMLGPTFTCPCRSSSQLVWLADNSIVCLCACVHLFGWDSVSLHFKWTHVAPPCTLPPPHPPGFSRSPKPAGYCTHSFIQFSEHLPCRYRYPQIGKPTFNTYRHGCVWCEEV